MRFNFGGDSNREPDDEGPIQPLIPPPPECPDDEHYFSREVPFVTDEGKVLGSTYACEKCGKTLNPLRDGGRWRFCHRELPEMDGAMVWVSIFNSVGAIPAFFELSVENPKGHQWNETDGTKDIQAVYGWMPRKIGEEPPITLFPNWKAPHCPDGSAHDWEKEEYFDLDDNYAGEYMCCRKCGQIWDS